LETRPLKKIKAGKGRKRLRLKFSQPEHQLVMPAAATVKTATATMPTAAAAMPSTTVPTAAKSK
jgi:hypothetical protein